MKVRPLLCAAAFAGVSLQLHPARGQAPELELDWQVPEGCPPAARVMADVRRLLGAARRAAPETRLRASVAVRQVAERRWTAQLETAAASSRGTRVLSGESCQAIASATSVILAFALDPEAALQNADALQTAEPGALDTTAPRGKPADEPARAVDEPVAPSHVALSGYARVSFGVVLELLPEPAAALELAVGARSEPWSLEVFGGYYQPRSTTRRDRPEVGAELQLYTVAALGCFALLRDADVGLGLCGGLELEHVSARAFGVTDPGSESELLGAFLAGVRASWHPTSWLSTALELRATARPFHPEFVIDGVGDVFDVPVFAPLAASGLEVEF